MQDASSAQIGHFVLDIKKHIQSTIADTDIISLTLGSKEFYIDAHKYNEILTKAEKSCLDTMRKTANTFNKKGALLQDQLQGIFSDLELRKDELADLLLMQNLWVVIKWLAIPSA